MPGKSECVQQGALVFIGHNVKFQFGCWKWMIGNNKCHVHLSSRKLLLTEAEAHDELVR
jgi:hypothetical protein